MYHLSSKRKLLPQGGIYEYLSKIHVLKKNNLLYYYTFSPIWRANSSWYLTKYSLLKNCLNNFSAKLDSSSLKISSNTFKVISEASLFYFVNILSVTTLLLDCHLNCQSPLLLQTTFDQPTSYAFPLKFLSLEYTNQSQWISDTITKHVLQLQLP